MKRLLKVTAASAIMLVGIAASQTGFAGGPHISFGVVVAPPVVYRPDPYPYYYHHRHHHHYYRQQVIVESVPPPVYVEQSTYYPQAAPIQQAQNYWYYCNAAGAYYPYVKQCPGGWQQVVPQPN